jgi:hypothetical protein
LWELSVGGAVQLVVRKIESLGGSVRAIKPSRCYLAADFLIPDGLSLDFLRTHRVPNHGESSQILRGDDLETFYHGAKKSPIQLRIYDKGREVEKGGTKLWFQDVWKVPSLDNVWRVEFQLRRAVLKQFSIHTVEDLLAHSAAVWSYLTEWFSLRLQDDSNTTRRTVHPWWLMVRACAEKFGPLSAVVRDFKSSPVDSSWFTRQGAAFLASYTAREGINDLEEAAVRYIASIEDYWSVRDFGVAVQKRLLRLGLPVPPESSESEGRTEAA